MRVRGLAAGAVALGFAAWLAAGGQHSPAPRPGTSAARATFGGGSPVAPLDVPLPGLRFAVPAGGHASILLDLDAAPGGADLAARLALASLLGVPGEWPLAGPLDVAALGPDLATSATPVPEPSALALILLGAGGLAAARAHVAAGRRGSRLAP